MSAPKHTKGPWNHMCDCVVVDRNGGLIGGTNLSVPKFRTRKQAIANAVLFAAAPELLATCKALLNDVNYADTLPSAIEARRVIAKAQGDT